MTMHLKIVFLFVYWNVLKANMVKCQLDIANIVPFIARIVQVLIIMNALPVQLRKFYIIIIVLVLVQFIMKIIQIQQNVLGANMNV